MSERPSFVKEDDFSCSICLNCWINNDPRILECKHTYCFNCLKKMTIENSYLTCPLCQQQCLIENNDINQLKVNVLQSIIKYNYENFSSKKAEVSLSFLIRFKGKLLIFFL